MSFKTTSAIQIKQPLANFYVAKFTARELLDITFSEELQYVDESGKLKGSQRKVDDKRLEKIARYIDSVEMSFPNSIILAANYTEDGQISEDDALRWRAEELEGGVFNLIIPEKIPLAAIIDGQHRLKAFEFVEEDDKKDIELVVSVFFDLPNSYQAYLFATINGNQKKVDKSLALEQFGFNVEDEPKKSWTPEKLAVFLTRKINFKKGSPLYKKIKLSPKYSEELEINTAEILISTATFVDGILSLISTNPKRDRVEMGQKHIFKGRSRSDLNEIRDSSPLRQLYLKNEDDRIYDVLTDFFDCVNSKLWSNAKKGSYIKKTVGIQALFDLLKKLHQINPSSNKDDYMNYINNFVHVDFTDNFFQASGTGRYRIKRVIFYANQLIQLEDIKEEERDDVERLSNNPD